MSTLPEESQLELNRIDQIFLWGSETSLRNGHVSPVAQLSILGSIGLGYGTGSLVDAIVFSAEGEWNRQTDIINTNQAQINEINSVTKKLQAEEIQIGNSKPVIDKLQHNIAVAESNRPEGYNPGLDSIVTIGSGLIAFSALFILAKNRFYKATHKKAELDKQSPKVDATTIVN